MEENIPGADVLEGIRSAIGVECLECGEINARDAEACESCGAVLASEMEEEDEGLSIMHTIGIGGTGHEQRKTPLAQAENLNLLRTTLEKTESGEMNMGEYYANIRKVMEVGTTGLELFETDVVKEKLVELPEGQRELINRTKEYLQKLVLGCETMLKYDGGTDGTLAYEGFAIAEKAFIEMDKVQDKALELSDEIDRENELEAAAKEAAEASGPVLEG